MHTFTSIMSSSPESKLTTAETLIATIGSIAVTAMVIRSVARDFLPPEFHDYLHFGLASLINKFSRQLTMVINKFDGYKANDLYNATELYLSSRILSFETKRVTLTKNPSNNIINVAMDVNECFLDTYNGVTFKWSLVSKNLPNKVTELSFELKFHQKHKDMVLNEYFPFIINDAKRKKLERRTLKLYTVDSEEVWTSVNLDHPSKFATLAMESDVKESVMKDLDRFVERREYYRKVGKAWKRGYLLYGPPGTGKSSLIAAMANYLNFDIYDLELADVKSNYHLRKLLVATRNRSILVVEDIDCSVELHDRANGEVVAEGEHHRREHHEEHKVTLSGFLNFIDGLWSSCGDERIIVFTTNRKEKLDPALLRPGRMDVHINMSYCTPCGFRMLAYNYLGITQHSLFEEIEDLIRKVEITPATVAEQLLRNNDPDSALGGLLEFICVKMKEKEEAKPKENY
ncbi:hypothetical protein M8C21_018125 [Ambrosia artemisiifolia]|uniref:AAA+ ATPase domain-containing protein n=1 Tax=Ambrosia artemisiifolia TaxID=4212 RepID=A0AAD5CRL4_AMBAR|nr:hypothetical protein M8C21_018125 [Ambrosia artemisiifolia]